MEDWDRTAWLCFWMPRLTKKKYTFEDFHPVRGQTKKVNIFKLNEWLKKVGENLPNELSEEEIDKKWEEYKRNAGSK